MQFAKELKTKIPWVTHIVGHAPVSCQAATWIRRKLYPTSQLILFYHVLPQDTDWMGESLPYPHLSTEDYIKMAQSCDVIFSVTSRVYEYFEAKFINRPEFLIDHRLYLPQSPSEVFAVRPEALGNLDPPSVLVLQSDDQADDQGIDIALKAMMKVAEVYAFQVI